MIGGHDPNDSTSIPLPAPSLTATLDDGVEGLRVGRITDLPEGADPDVLERVDAAFDALSDAGAKVVDVEVPAFTYGLTAYYLIAPAEASSNLARYDGVRYGLRVDAPDTNAMYMATREAGFGDEVKRRIMLGTYALSAGYYDAYYGKALKVRRLIADDFARAYEHADVLLTPTSPSVAFEFGDKTDNPLAMYLCDTYTIPSNLSGHPGMNVPFGTGAGGLPVGVQVLAPALGEATMFRVARLEDAAPDGMRRAMQPSLTALAHSLDSRVPVTVRRLRARRRAGGPRRAGDGVEALLRQRQPLRGRAQHQHRPGDARPAGGAAGAQPRRRRAGDAHRAGAQLPHPAVRVPPQELLLSRHAEGVPDQPVRRSAQRRRLARPARRHPGRHRAGPPRGGHRQVDPRRRRRRTHPRQRRVADRLQPRRRAARRDRQPARPPQQRAGPPVRRRAARASCSRSVPPTPRWRRARCAWTPTSACTARRALRHPVRDQEPQLAALARPGDRLRGAPADRPARGGRRGPPGDPPLGRGRRPHAHAADQGGRRRLPLLPRARPRAAGARRRVDRDDPGRAPAASGRAPGPARRCHRRPRWTARR